MKLVAGEVGEDLQDPLGGGGCAVTELGVERDVVQGCGCHGGADLSFDEGGDEQGQELAAEQPLDPGRVLQQYGVRRLGRF